MSGLQKDAPTKGVPASFMGTGCSLCPNAELEHLLYYLTTSGILGEKSVFYDSELSEEPYL